MEMITEIESFTVGMSFTDFEQDTKTVKAVLYNLAIIGEAAGQLLPEVESLYPVIPWVDMRAIRNVIIHEYFQVNLSIIWETIKTDFPLLREQLQELLEQLNMNN